MTFSTASDGGVAEQNKSSLVNFRCVACNHDNGGGGDVSASMAFIIYARSRNTNVQPLTRALETFTGHVEDLRTSDVLKADAF